MFKILNKNANNYLLRNKSIATTCLQHSEAPALQLHLNLIISISGFVSSPKIEWGISCKCDV